MLLNTVHKTAERLVIESGETGRFEEYALSLLQLASNAGMSEVRQMLLPGPGYWEPEGFEHELLTAAAYTNNISLARRLVNSHLAWKEGVLGNPYKAALRERNFNILNIFFEDPQSVDAKLKDRLVKKAAWNGDKEMVEFIYQATWSPSEPNRYYGTSGPHATDTKGILQTPSPEIFNIIMQERKTTNGDPFPLEILNFLLRNAARRGWVDMIRHIISLGGTPEAWPFKCACESGQDEVVKLLLPYQNHPLSAELEAAASRGNISTLKLLLEHGADVNTELAKNCLSVAAAKGHLEIVRMLLDAGKSPNEGDIAPMIHAVRAEHPGICQLLIEQGATMSMPEAIAEDLNSK
jgi:hypothetical protein